MFYYHEVIRTQLRNNHPLRHGSSRFGGSDTVLFQLAPKLNRWESSASIYCNFKIRSAVFGLSFKDILKINKDMSNIQAVEVGHAYRLGFCTIGI